MKGLKRVLKPAVSEHRKFLEKKRPIHFHLPDLMQLLIEKLTQQSIGDEIHPDKGDAAKITITSLTQS